MASITKREGIKGTAYKVTVRIKGYPTATATFSKLTDAKKWASDTESAIHKGKYFQAEEARRHTLTELIDKYVKNEFKDKPKSKAKQEAQLNWWKDQIGNKTLADVTPAIIKHCKDELLRGTTYRGEIRSGATVNRYMAALSHVFTIAKKEYGWIENNPLSQVKKAKESAGRVRFLSDDERQRLLAACQESRNKQLYLIVMLALSTGARQGEIMGLTWEDVSFDQKRIILRDTKNGETRAVPLVSNAYNLLKEHAKVRRLDTNLVFPRPGIHGKKPISIREAWDNAVIAAQLENFRFHDLRHSCASYLAMNGATLAEIAEVLGHKTLQMVKRYAHLSDQHVSSVVERMNQKIFGA